MKLDRLVRDFDQHPHVSQSSKQFIGFATDGDFRVMNPLLVAWEKLTGVCLFVAEVAYDDSDPPSSTAIRP